MRSKLFVPGTRPEFFAKAASSDADALSFDLEDSVAEAGKDKARAALAAFLAMPGAVANKIVVVRINAQGTRHYESDMAAMARPGVDLINLPMVETVETIRDAAALLDRLEAAVGVTPAIGLLINIETPRALRLAAQLACAHPRVAGLQIGYADLLEPIGIDRQDAAALAHIRTTVRLAAAEAGIPAYDGAFGQISDAQGYQAECEAARRQGYAGKSCIHPSQIAIANAAFLPNEAEIARAGRVLAAAREAQAKGIGAFLVDGQMIDAPFLLRARAIVALSDAAARPNTDPDA